MNPELLTCLKTQKVAGTMKDLGQQQTDEENVDRCDRITKPQNNMGIYLV